VSRAELIAFLGRQRLGVVSSISADGGPQSAVVGIATSQTGEILFDTLGGSCKATNLRRDPRVSLVVWQDERTAQLQGTADEPIGRERARLLEIYFAAYPDGRERLAWPDITHFRITPTWARYSDFATAPQPTIVTFDFRQAY
jgi:PPOX class probable F420-dependent enzyme